MQSSELLRLSHTSIHCHLTRISLTRSVLKGPPDTHHQKITTCQAEQAGAESQALPHWLTAFQEKTSIPVKAETTKEICMQPQCEQGRTLQQLRCKALAGGGLPSALLYHHNTQPGALHSQDTDSTICHPPCPLCTLFSKTTRTLYHSTKPRKAVP